MTRALQRPEVWALLAGLAIVIIYMASMAAAGPWDPWETHYGEVARQILRRRDPMDLWWQAGTAGPDALLEKSFASKPALPFWAMALSMKVFGVGTGADPAEMVQPLWPELAIRLPSVLAGLSSAMLLGYVAWRLVSPRCGVLAGVVLCTMPQWAIVSRQALTDMFFVGPVVLACCAWAMAWLQPDRALKTRVWGRWEVPWDRAHLAFVVLLVLGALVPLAVLHQHAFDPFTWKYHVGRSTARAQSMRDIQVQMFAYWVLAVMVVLRSLGWRRRSQAWMGILYLGAGLSLIGKGMIGPGLIGAVVLAHLSVSGRWDLLRKAGLPTGFVLFALASFPWHHAMMLYRGERWVSELIIENNLRRFASGEQKQAVGGHAYYLETLGLAALPWVAVLPVAILAGVRAFQRRVRAALGAPGAEPSAASSGPSSTVQLQRFALLWFAVSMLAISFSVTKYYHYLLPVLPPAALLVAVWVDRAADGARTRSMGTLAGVLVGLALLVAIVRDAMASPAWIAHLTTYLYTGFWTKGAPEVDRLMITVAPFGIGLVAWLVARRRAAIMAFVLSGLVTTAYVIDDYIPAASESWSQRTAIRTYFAERGPDDRLVSWWFYYRGETFFTKGNIWVMRDPNRQVLADYIAEREGENAHLWFITIDSHVSRLATNLPPRYRDGIEEVYRNFHYVLMRVHVP
jgi:4-amino-4-deoxy-L-arabinose transferase-like glycosyltransferase